MKPKIVFFYESNHPIVVEDGLSASLKALETTFEIERTNIINQDVVPQPTDFVLGWGAFGGRVDQLCKTFPNKKGLCIGGCTPPIEASKYDVLFYETKWYRDNYLKYCDNVVHAFGVNTEIYQNLNIVRDVDYLGVGAFAKWKRWENMLGKGGKRRVIGEFQRGNPVESQVIWDLLESGEVLCKDMMPARLLNFEYNRAKTVYIPAEIMGGGERAVLEARACGCQVEVEPDNPKLQELLTSPIYDVNYYVKQLTYGLQSCL